MKKRFVIATTALFLGATYFAGLALEQRTQSVELSGAIKNQRELRDRLLAMQVNTAGHATAQFAQNVSWQSSETETAEQQLQTWALDALGRNNILVRQYRPASRSFDPQLATIALRLEFTGSLASVSRLIAEIEQSRPALGISNLQLRPMAARDQRDGATMLVGQITIWGLVEGDDA